METVVASRGASVLPEATSERVVEPERRRARWPAVAYVVSALIVAGAVFVAVDGNQTRRSAAESLARTDTLTQEQAEARRSAAEAEQTAEVLIAQVRTVQDVLGDWDAVSDRYLSARNEFVAAGNAAIDLGNAGDFEAALDRFEGEVSDRLADLEPLIVAVEEGNTELNRAVQRLDRLVDQLKEVAS